MQKLFVYMEPFKARLYWSVGAGVSNKIADLMPPLLVAWIIDSVNGHPPSWIQSVTGSSNPFYLALFLAILAIIIFGVESFFQWAYQYGFMTLAQKVQHTLRLETYQHLQKREMAFFENHRLGNTLSILNDDINQLERFLYTGFVELLHLVVLLLFSGYIMAITAWQLALFGLLPIPVILWGSLYYQKIISPYYTQVRNAVGRLSNRLENNLSGILVIKSFCAEKFEFLRVKKASDAYQKQNLEVIKRNAMYVPLIRMLVAAGFAGVLLLGSYWILEGKDFLSVGQLVLFSMLIQRVLWPLTRLGVTLDDFERAGASAKRVFDLLETPSSIRNPDNPSVTTSIAGHLNFKNIGFHYDANIPILKNITLTINAGETIGIAGTTGSGKSSLVKLLLRLYDPTQGTLCMDSVNLKQLPLRTIRKNIALVSQDVYLFHGSIFENIAYGKENASLEEVIAASQLAQLHGFVESLPQKYHAIVGERGIKLSGGQRQRLSIARALLKNSPVMIFDEATSAVDTETEKAIQANIHALTRGKTALIIAHRLSTIRYASKIIVLEKGTIVESGTHEALLKANKQYAALWRIQIGESRVKD